MKELIKTIIKDFHKSGIPEFKKRSLDVPLNSGKIVALIGPRRAGKTYTLYQIMSGIHDITDIIYINFEDERLRLKSDELNLIIESYYELYPDKKNIFIFFDEMQEVPLWEKFVRRLYDTVSKKIFITGSSSKLLSKEIATSLRGRTITYNIFPLSFKEFCDFNQINPEVYSTKGKAKLVSAFKDYMEKGGFPELIGKPSQLFQKILQSYFDVMIYRDIIERHDITNVTALKYFIKKLLSNISKETSINKIYNELKSQGIRISKDSLYEYIDFCEDSFILLPIKQFSESMTKQATRKVYSIDVALSQLVSFTLSRDLGRILENIVLLELKRNEKEVYYFKDKFECDFIIKDREKITEAIQVCLELNENNQKREIEGIKEAMSRFKLRKGTILTLDREKPVENIKIIPVWKWLLES